MYEALCVVALFVCISMVLALIWGSPGCGCNCQQGRNCSCGDVDE